MDGEEFKKQKADDNANTNDNSENVADSNTGTAEVRSDIDVSNEDIAESGAPQPTEEKENTESKDDVNQEDTHEDDVFDENPRPRVMPDYEEEDDAPTPEERVKRKQTALEQLSVIYPVMAKEFGLRFRKNPEDAEKLAQFLVKILNGKGNNAAKWKEYIDNRCNKGTSKSIIQNKIIPTLTKSCGDIELPRQVNNDQTADLMDRNGQKVGSIIIPEGFNQKPASLGDSSVTMDLGFPAINYNSELIKEILTETDRGRLKKLLKALIKRVNGTPAAKSILDFGWFDTRSKIYKILKTAASAQGIPMKRRPLKVESELIIGNSEEDNINVIPINTIGNREAATESVNEGIPLVEGWFSENVLGKTDSSSEKMFGKEISLPKNYLRQYYTVLTPSGTSGLGQYVKFMTHEDRADMFDKLGDEADEITSSNRNLNDMIFQHYINKTNGIPPYYILVPRNNPKERIRVCDDTVINGQVCIKSLVGKNRDAYFMPEKLVDSLFEAG